MRSFSYEGILQADVPMVAALYTNKEFLTAFVKSLDSQTAKIHVSDRAASLIWQVPTKDFPGVLRTFVGNRVPLNEEINWTTVDGSRAEGPYLLSIDVSGQQARLDATSTLVPNAAGCFHRIGGKIKVDLPFIGSKIEEAAISPLLWLMNERTKFANSWLREHG